MSKLITAYQMVYISKLIHKLGAGRYATIKQQLGIVGPVDSWSKTTATEFIAAAKQSNEPYAG